MASAASIMLVFGALGMFIGNVALSDQGTPPVEKAISTGISKLADESQPQAHSR
jgi:hypothetical protein